MPYIQVNLLLVAVGEGGPTESDIAENLKEAGFEIGPWSFSCTKATGESELRAEVRWSAYAVTYAHQNFFAQSSIYQVSPR